MGSPKEEGRSLKSEKEGPSFRFEGNDGAALGDDGVLDPEVEELLNAEPQSSMSLRRAGVEWGEWLHSCSSLLKEKQWMGEASLLDEWPLGHFRRIEFLKGRVVTSVHFNVNIHATHFPQATWPGGYSHSKVT